MSGRVVGLILFFMSFFEVIEFLVGDKDMEFVDVMVCMLIVREVIFWFDMLDVV